MTFVPESWQLRGLSYEAAGKFGMPHLGAHYRCDSPHANVLDCDMQPCAVCGRPAANSHHEPPIGMGGRNAVFTLSTERGAFFLKPALIAVCGSGTSGCHHEFHGGARYSIRWAWHSDAAAERWWSGWYLTRGYVPHDPRLYRHGHWEITDKQTGRVFARSRIHMKEKEWSSRP